MRFMGSNYILQRPAETGGMEERAACYRVKTPICCRYNSEKRAVVLGDMLTQHACSYAARPTR